MAWLYLVLASIIFTSLQQVVQRIILKEDKSDPVAYSVLFQLITGSIIGIYALILGKFELPSNFTNLIPNLVFATALYSIGNIIVFFALKNVQASIFTILFSTRGVFGVLIASIFLNEGFTLLQWIGTSVIFLAILMSNYKSFNGGFTKSSGVYFAILGALLFGIANVNDRFILMEFELYSYLVIAFIAPSLVSILFRPSTFNGVVDTIKDSKKIIYIIIISIISSISALTFFGALQLADNGSQVMIIALSSVITTVLLSALILKEKDGLFIKLIASVITFVGLVLVSI